MIHTSRTFAILFAGRRFLPQSVQSQLLSTENAGITANPLSRADFSPMYHKPITLLITTDRLGSLCANFAVVAPTLRPSTREAALPADLALVEKWRQSSQQLADLCSSSTPGSASRQHAKPNLEAPGGAFVMESLIHTGMYAPTETLIFHHIILVCTFAY